MRTWFGRLEEKNVILAGNSVNELAKWAESSDSKELTRMADLQSLAMKSGLCPSPEEYRRLLHETAMQVARDHISMSLAGKDAYLMQAVKSLDDLNEAYNILTSRMGEWYGIHYPEQRLRPNELLDFILQHGSRETIPSIGAAMDRDDVAAIQGLGLAAKALFYQRKALEGYINSAMEEVAPNLSNLLGPLLGARLIARAGSLEKLAKMPASTIQVMGAGDALFKHLRTGSPSPKHGLIFKHPLISGSPKSARGKISRMIASKAAIAARVDHYSGDAMDFDDLNEKVAAIKARMKERKKT